MISFQSGFAVLPSCDLLHDFRLFRLTLRPSALVFCCHRVSWARGRLAFAQEAVRVSPFSFFLDFSALVDFRKVLQAAIEKFLFMRCGDVMALQIREIVFGSPTFLVPTPYSTTYSGTLECAHKSRRLIALCLVPLFDDYDSTNFLKIVSLCFACLCTEAFSFQSIAVVGSLLVP